MSNKGSFIPLGMPAQKVVVDLAPRIKAKREASSHLMEMLKASKADLDERRRVEVERGKGLLTKALGIIQDNSDKATAVAHLKEALAAIGGE